MERGGFHHHRKRSNSSPAFASMAGILPNANINNPNSDNQESGAQSPPCPVREKDQYMPMANVVRIMRRILPAQAKISDDAKEAIQECVSEYISFITGEANERCQVEGRKTLTTEDLLWAMGKLGFDNYIGPLSLFLGGYRAVKKQIPSQGQPLLRRSNSLDCGSIGLNAYKPSFPIEHQSHHLGFLDQTTITMNGYFKNMLGVIESESRAAFDLNAQYK